MGRRGGLPILKPFICYFRINNCWPSQVAPVHALIFFNILSISIMCLLYTAHHTGRPLFPSCTILSPGFSTLLYNWSEQNTMINLAFTSSSVSHLTFHSCNLWALRHMWCAPWIALPISPISNENGHPR